jgi:CheY-like chemotaxis protein
LVKQILSFTRGIEGKSTNTQVNHLLREVYKIIQQTFPKTIELSPEFASDLWLIPADATLLHQVFMNLCVNARDAMPNGGTLTVSGENVEVDDHFASMNPGAQLGPHVVFRVSDTGMGMSPETMERIFDPFFTTKEVGKGTGLGLATVIGIVKSHGGFLSVQSEIGVGTTFRVFVPSARDTEVGKKREELGAVSGGKGELVLVVDDEMPIREALVRTLKTNGYHTYTAEDGTDALALYYERREEIALVITDLSMGGMDGIQLVRALRKVNPEVRVVVSSGHFQKENTTILGALGVKHFLDKPYTADKLLRAVQGAMAPQAA